MVFLRLQQKFLCPEAETSQNCPQISPCLHTSPQWPESLTLTSFGQRDFLFLISSSSCCNVHLASGFFAIPPCRCLQLSQGWERDIIGELHPPWPCCHLKLLYYHISSFGCTLISKARGGLDFSLATQSHRTGVVCPVFCDPYSEQTLNCVLGVCLNLQHKLWLSWCENLSRLEWMGKPVLSSPPCSLIPWQETQKTPKGKMAPEVASDVVQPVTTHAMTFQMVHTRPAGRGRIATRAIKTQKGKL